MKPGSYSKGEPYRPRSMRDDFNRKSYGDRGYKEYMSPHNPEKVMMRLPEIRESRSMYKDSRNMVSVNFDDDDYKENYAKPSSDMSVGDIFADRDVNASDKKKRKFFRDPQNEAFEEMERRLGVTDKGSAPQDHRKHSEFVKAMLRKAEERQRQQNISLEDAKRQVMAEIDEAAAEKEKEKTQEMIAELSDDLNPDKIKARAVILPDEKMSDIMQWGWSVERLFARRQDEIQSDYIKSGAQAKSHTGEVTERIKKVTSGTQAGALKRIWLRAIRRFDDAMTAEFKNNRGDYFPILNPQDRFEKTLEFVADLERAIEDDITLAQNRIGICESASLEMDQFYTALKSYERELKRNRTAIIDKARERADTRFDGTSDALKALHDSEVLDSEKNVDERTGYLEIAVQKCEGEYGFYVSAIKHEKGAIDALQNLMRERLPRLEKDVKRGLGILAAQQAMKAKGAGATIDPAFDLSPEQAETELKAIAALVTLEVDAVEKIHAAIIHDERLVIKHEEPTALIEAKQELLALENTHNGTFLLPSPSKTL